MYAAKSVTRPPFPSRELQNCVRIDCFPEQRQQDRTVLILQLLQQLDRLLGRLMSGAYLGLVRLQLLALEGQPEVAHQLPSKPIWAWDMRRRA